jgi:hypothetical protein
MSEFSLIKDPVRNSIFALVVKENDEINIFPFNNQAKSWANSQFDDNYSVPDGMTSSGFKQITTKTEKIISKLTNQCCNGIEKKEVSLFSSLLDAKHVFTNRSKTGKKSTVSSFANIRNFDRKTKNSIIDFKAKMFLKRIKKSNNTEVHSDNEVTNRAALRRMSRRVKSLEANYSKDTYSVRRKIDMSIGDKSRKFRA